MRAKSVLHLLIVIFLFLSGWGAWEAVRGEITGHVTLREGPRGRTRTIVSRESDSTRFRETIKARWMFSGIFGSCAVLMLYLLHSVRIRLEE